jgi:hypothetical protein
MIKLFYIATLSVVMGYSVVNATTEAPPAANKEIIRPIKKVRTFLRAPLQGCIIDPSAIEESTLKCVNQRKKWLHI